MAQNELKIAEMDTTVSTTQTGKRYQKLGIKQDKSKRMPDTTTKHILPPPRPQKLYIPTPKCQRVGTTPQTSRIEMTPT